MHPDRLSPDPGMEEVTAELPTDGGSGMAGHPGSYLQKEGSHSGKRKSQSQPSLGNSRQDGGDKGQLDPGASSSHPRDTAFRGVLLSFLLCKMGLD